jgi:hypothetical protein
MLLSVQWRDAAYDKREQWDEDARLALHKVN